MLCLCSNELQSVDWHCVVVDEIHSHFSNHKNKAYQAISQIRTRYKYGLTGTLMSVSYKLSTG